MGGAAFTGGAGSLGGSTASGDAGNAGSSAAGSGNGGASIGGAGGVKERPTILAAPGSTLVRVDAETRHQTFEGWGTSLAWWAHQIGGWSEAKRDELLELIVDPNMGLGYSIFRYNIGGGDEPSHDHMGANREMPGFQASNGTWDWNADSRQTSVLARLVATGEDVIIEAFSNSPPYWMTKSGCASGNGDGSDNLKEDAYDDFAAYLVTVTEHYRDEWGIVFRTLEPLNEPNASWWKANGGQEGCHFGPSNQERIIRAVADELRARGVSGTRVSAADENSLDDALTIMSGYAPETFDAIEQINVHTYHGSKRRELQELAISQGKRLWQSESGPLSVELATNTDAALFMAGRIIQDLRELQPEAWIEWQVIDPAMAWTSFAVDDRRESWAPVKRFYAQAGFSRFIRPGATFIAVDDANMVAAIAGEGSTLALVVRNGDTSETRRYTFDLTSLPGIGASARAYRTSASEDLAELPPVPVEGWSIVVTAPPYSITTLVVPLTG